ncbi:hypothetical protein B0H14DRAFT_2897552, partial [Mycena olivaceomarginata]
MVSLRSTTSAPHGCSHSAPQPSLCYATPSSSPSFRTSDLDESFFAVSLPVIGLIAASTTQSGHTGLFIQVKFTLSSASDLETSEPRPRSAFVRRVNHQNWAIVVFFVCSLSYLVPLQCMTILIFPSSPYHRTARPFPCPTRLRYPPTLCH